MDCPDRESCVRGYPCDLVRTINGIKTEEDNAMTNSPKHTIASVAAEATKAVSDKTEDIKTNVDADNRTDVINEAVEDLSKATKKLKAVTNDSSDDDGIVEDGGIGETQSKYYTIRIPRINKALFKKRAVAIGLSAVALTLASAGFVKLKQNRTVAVVVTNDETNEQQVFEV